MADLIASLFTLLERESPEQEEVFDERKRARSNLNGRHEEKECLRQKC